MAILQMPGYFSDYMDTSHNLTNYSQDIYFTEGTNQIEGVNFAYIGYYHIELQNAHFEDFPSFIDHRDPMCTPNLTISPNNLNENITVNFIGFGEIISSFTFTPEEFNTIIMKPSENGHHLSINPIT